jgi:2',3'-cyclic-nucleotide 2'-phosphodiesterase (5'-nucleotidase family)
MVGSLTTFVVGFMNPGGVRGAGFVNTATVPTYPYDITYGNAFTVQPFGNALVTMILTSQQIKDTLRCVNAASASLLTASEENSL